MTDVSAIICTRNCESMLDDCLASVAAALPREIVIVDGLSTDGTLEIARRHADIVLSDGGLGLAHARNLGVAASCARYVAFIGPDNILQPTTLEEMVGEMHVRGWAGVSAQTRVRSPRTYLAISMDSYKMYRFGAGERDVIGTPTLFERTTLQAHQFDPNATSSDDADLCHRLRQAGLRLGISPASVFEQGTCSPSSVLARWRWYGRSDAEYYSKYAGEWQWPRKLRSFFHPVTCELCHPARRALRRGDFEIIPFLLAITAIRYGGWAEAAMRGPAVTPVN